MLESASMTYLSLVAMLMVIGGFTTVWLETRRNGWVYLLLGTGAILNALPRYVSDPAKMPIAIAGVVVSAAGLVGVIVGLRQQRASRLQRL